MIAEENNGPSLLLIRGLPGSGKSTLARRLCQADEHFHIEADMFMTDAKGRYRFSAAKLGEVHARCEQETRQHLQAGHHVIVANTFSQIWEMQPYLDMAKTLGIPVQIIECQGQFKSIHDVPERSIRDMRNRWEKLPKP
ncbi:ATP-binding protein [Thalassospira marina]|uniref:AAA family ATPase n=1 Tax=Thalassospira marina TaxID=2048283 RepID=A0A2N3KR98_9PROT|nr:ATP-binding protein [Thalassospira marina]PKR53077.1 AAA family ATPase [Thalassospira marina]